MKARKRIHLFEFGDQRWLPQVFREAETGYLVVAYRLFPLSRVWAEKISTALTPGEPGEIVDLCSGSGGAMPLILKELKMLGFEVRAKLTDLSESRCGMLAANFLDYGAD